MNNFDITISHSVPKESLPKIQVLMSKHNMRFISEPIILEKTALLFYGTNNEEDYKSFSQKIEEIVDRKEKKKPFFKNPIQRILTTPKPSV